MCLWGSLIRWGPVGRCHEPELMTGSAKPQWEAQALQQDVCCFRHSIYYPGRCVYVWWICDLNAATRISKRKKKACKQLRTHSTVWGMERVSHVLIFGMFCGMGKGSHVF